MKPYACKDREPYVQTVRMQGGWIQGGPYRVAEMKDVPFRMNPDCQYTLTELGKVDARCGDCKHRKA